MVAKTRISVVIPNYNNMSYLSQAIQSAIEASSDFSVDIVIVDDGSTDDSLAVAESFGNAIRLYQNESNIGQERTTNRGLRYAMGEYVVILHSDDLLNKNFFKDLVPLLDQYPMAVMAVGERIEINEQGDILLSPAPFYDGDYLIPGVEQAKVFLVSGFLPCQVLFRRNVVLEFGGAKAGFQVNLDGLLWFKASLFGDIAYRQNVVSSYRRHQGSLTSNLTPTLTHLFEYYSTIKEMFLFANKQQVDLSGERQRAFDRIADLAIRYSKEIYASGEVELARRFIAFATAVNAGVKDTDAFLDISSAIDQGSEVTNPFSERLISYEPPVGSKPIKVS